MKLTTKCWLALGVLALLSPLGLILPAYFQANSAWGEWDAAELQKLIGYVPQGVAKLGHLWNAPLPDYGFKGETGHSMTHLSFAYIVSAVVGMGLVALLAWLIGKLMATPALGPGRAGATVAPRQLSRPTRSSRDFVSRSIRSALAFLKEAVFAEETAVLPGGLQSLDPRIKLTGILFLLLTTLCARTLAGLGILYLLCLLLAVLSRLRLGFFLLRTWFFIPLFSLAIAIPSLFSFVSPGPALASVGIFHVTQQGIYAAAFFVGRVLVSVSLAVLLSLTTRHAALLKALRAFGVPNIFVMVLGICYRYIYLFVELVENTYLAIRSRTGNRLHHRQGQHLVSWNIGQLWSRSYALNEHVYQAMLSRGFRGEPVTLDHLHTRLRDWLWLAGVMLVCGALMAI